VPSSDTKTEADRLAAVRAALLTVTDPEVPVLNVVEMGMIADARIEGDRTVVDLTPTFAGCPALDVIRADIQRAVRECGEVEVTVIVVYDPQWTTDRMTDAARAKLKAFGLAPPGARCAGGQTPDLTRTPCPYCDSTETEVESIFGPTLCRSIHYCNTCLQSFEHFKSV
jgi:ring-1,2-phenylacetyl-CoA epoxidase subunit PaaD